MGGLTAGMCTRSLEVDPADIHHASGVPIRMYLFRCACCMLACVVSERSWSEGRGRGVMPVG